MKILVTGGNGFIGSHVVDNLLLRGIEPVIFDKHRDKNLREGVETFLGDVRDFTAVNGAVPLCDGVIHLAGVLGTSETIKEPLPSVDINVYGSLNVFKACYNYNKKAVYISVGNYWMNNSYSITKSTAARFAWMFNRELNTKIAVVKGLNVYGPKQKHYPVRKIIPNFIIPALRGEEITVYGDGSQIMDMIYVTDIADILVRALLIDHNQYVHDPVQFPTTFPGFNAGTGRYTTVQEIAQTVIDLVGSGSIKNVPMRQGEPEGSIVIGDPGSLTVLYPGETLQLTVLEDGLIETIKYYRELLNE